MSIFDQNFKYMKKILVAIVTIAFLASCSTSKVAVQKDLIEVGINLNNVVDDKVQVEVNPQIRLKMRHLFIAFQQLFLERMQ